MTKPRLSLCFGSAKRLGSRLTLHVLAPLALLASVGCYKMSDSSYAMSEAPPMPEAQTVDVTGAANYRYDEAGGEYDFEEDLMNADRNGAEATAGVIAAPRTKLGDAREWSPPVRTEPGAPSTTDGKLTKTKDDPTPDHGRQIIYVAGIQVSVYNLAEGMAAVEALPDRFGGWIHMRNQSQVVLRLPANQLKSAMTELATLGVVEARTLQAQDVTAEYVDLDSRIKVLRDTQTQLLDLLSKAKTVEEALHVRRALDDVTMELEVALGRMRQLSDLIAFSTLTVTLVERGPQDHIPTSNDPFGWVDSLGVEATEWR